MLADQTQTDLVTLTPAAAQAVTGLLTSRNLEGYALRVFISGGGCSGYQIGLALDNKLREEDLKFTWHGVQVVVDEVSIQYLRGATVDYVEDAMGSGFKIENPNALPSCGCGSSADSADCSSGSCGCG